MEKLTTNEEKVRKELLKFPGGIKARQLGKQVFLMKTPLYAALNRLEGKELAFRGANSLWHPYPVERKQPSKMDESVEKRLDVIRQENLVNPQLAFFDLFFFMCTLPADIQNRLVPDVFAAVVEMGKSGKPRLFEEEARRQERQKVLISTMVLYFINRIPVLLNEHQKQKK